MHFQINASDGWWLCGTLHLNNNQRHCCGNHLLMGSFARKRTSCYGKLIKHTYIKFVLDNTRWTNYSNYFQLICTGKFDEEWLSEPKKIPTVAYSLLICFLLGMVATIITHIFKRIGKKKQFRQNPTIRENTVDLGSLTISACLMTLIVMSFYSLVKYER